MSHSPLRSTPSGQSGQSGSPLPGGGDDYLASLRPECTARRAGKRRVLIVDDHRDVTGRGQDDDRRKSCEGGFDHHLTKPVDFTVLLHLITQNRR